MWDYLPGLILGDIGTVVETLQIVANYRVKLLEHDEIVATSSKVATIV